jgi:hypothetical protein
MWGLCPRRRPVPRARRQGGAPTLISIAVQHIGRRLCSIQEYRLCRLRWTIRKGSFGNAYDDKLPFLKIDAVVSKAQQSGRSELPEPPLKVPFVHDSGIGVDVRM